MAAWRRKRGKLSAALAALHPARAARARWRNKTRHIRKKNNVNAWRHNEVISLRRMWRDSGSGINNQRIDIVIMK